MTLPLELRGRKGTGDAEAPELLPAAPSPSQDSYLLHSSVWVSVFIFHVLSWHERDLFPSLWRGRLWLALGSQRDEAGAEGRGQLFSIQSIKTARTTRNGAFPGRTGLLSPVKFSKTCSFT